MGNANLYSLFSDCFPSNPEAVFLDMPDGRQLRYADVPAETGRMLSWLNQMGVGEGDRVVVQVEKSIDGILLYLACLRAGAIYVPLNTAYTSAEVAYFLKDAEPSLFVCAPEHKAALEHVATASGVARTASLGVTGDGDILSGHEGQPVSEGVAEVQGNDLAAVLYTSGTTGRSKGAMLSHLNLASNAQVLHKYWQWQSDDVLLHALPVFHVHGLFVALHCALLGGSRVLFMPRFDVTAVVDALPKATVFMGVPTFYTRLLGDDRLAREHVGHVRLFISGSAPLLAETHREFECRTGHRILERYGMTETGMITSNPYVGERVPGTVGFPLPGTSVRIADEKGNVLPAGEKGLLELTGDSVCTGYWRKSKKTARAFRSDGWFISGDLAAMDEEGRVTLLGRATDLIISGGLNVYPKEIETRIDGLAGIRESAVVGVPHPDLGEGVIAIVVADGGSQLTETSVINGIQDHVARFKQPKRVFIVDELPRNAMGKVQKAVLRDSYKKTFV